MIDGGVVVATAISLTPLFDCSFKCEYCVF